MDYENLLDMNLNTIIVRLHKFVSLNIVFCCPIKQLNHFCEGIVTLNHKNGKNYLLESSDAELIAYKLHKFLYEEKKCTFKGNLGLLWNEILAEKAPAVPYYIEEKNKWWFGLKYQLWSTPSTSDPLEQTDTWLYRRNKKLIFMVTPSYGWHFSKRRQRKKFIPYAEFIKNFKPILKIALDEETKKKLLQWSAKILHNIEEARKKAQNNYERVQQSDA